ncbi:unannotated protein [freshwater metagenome]|uniref:Unannotated protein n=1 Tax=freshwater metagenome TaxID=449393 RepID=A0A6J6UH22_9ZZZZ
MTIAPSPNVKAMGGLPANTSLAVGLTMWALNVSAIASTSRWKCIVALGLPVVPEVNARRQTSSAEVSAGALTADAARH